MGYVFDFNDSKNYELRFLNPRNVHAFDLQMGLMLKMLAPEPGRSILDIGCGTGRTLEPLIGHDLLLTGIDPSPYMLDIAREKLGDRADIHRAFAEQLPFEDNTFHYSFFFTSLEFTEMPAKAIEEACRVTKDRVFIGALNKYAPLNILRKLKSIFIKKPLYQARFFSILELRQISFDILGDVPIQWKTTLQFPFNRSRICRWIETLSLVEKSPFGTVIGMTITPVPRFTTRPLSLKIKEKGLYNPVSGFAMNKQNAHENRIQ
ncbi:putative SAM-dependent methyltransferase [Desulfamplus magnetovallimortis]|uniref:Putative SAM-dependent methyltransferase n=1 Tax=Desulfamplus magnetovallimortis TaxID=1246637 RepID=A0A1W1HG10_9BACT|nr:class I SAM-dependent methyltransferase [Desulfamplus magnetovallimortis]SLM31328.1 putative SAM-dependent methyltransferase [Desulfamplus magnetovallimortis]